MREDIRQRIEIVQNGGVPEGYQKHKDFGIILSEWRIGCLSNVLVNKQRPVKKPEQAYWRLGIRSHAKGTFHELIDDPSTVDMEELYRVRSGDFIVNITFAWEHAIALAKDDDDGLLVSHRFPTYVFRNGQNPQFYFEVFKRKLFQNMLMNISPGGAGRNRVMSKGDFLKLPCYMPNAQEQVKIAEVLEQCDHILEHKTELLVEKRKRKKWLLENLLDPDNGIRLEGFGGEWQLWSLGEVGTIQKGKGISNEDCKPNGTVSCVKYGDIYMNYDTHFSETVSYTDDEGARQSIFAQNGSLLFTCSGEDAMEIGKCVAYLGEEQIAVGGDIVILTLRPGFDPLFVAYQQSTISAIKEKATYSQGHSIVHLYGSQIKLLTLCCPPSLAEQRAIAHVLSTADREIDLLQQEIEQWKLMKKALSQLLLTGLVRV